MTARAHFNSDSRYSRFTSFNQLRDMDLFSNLQDDDLLKLVSVAQEQHIRKGNTLIRQNENSVTHLFVILDGEASVTWENADGFQSLLATLRSGDTVGEMELFDTNSRCTTVRAVSAMKLLAVHRDVLLKELREQPDLALGLLSGMAKRLSQSNRRVAGICNQRVPRRVASVLVSMLDENGVRGKDTAGRHYVLLHQRPVQRVVAELAGTARETVSRLYAGWEKIGLLEDRHDGFKVLDEVQLRHLAGEG